MKKVFNLIVSFVLLAGFLLVIRMVPTNRVFPLPLSRQ